MKLGKLGLSGSINELEKECVSQGIEIIPIKAIHMDKMLELPLFSDHKDPFDRLILAICLSEDLSLISTDMRMRKPEYGVKAIW